MIDSPPPLLNLPAFVDYLTENASTLLRQTAEHVGLTAASVALATLLGVPLGIWCVRADRARGFILGIAGVLQTIPSMALLGFLIPLLGIGAVPAVAALFLYALLPIIRNTYAGITGVDAAVREAAVGMGLSPWQVLTQVELPLALPVLLAGIRTATVINVGVATLAALIASGGLGESIFGGIALNNTAMILAGAIPAALLAVLLDGLLGRLQRSNLAHPRRSALVLLALLVVFVPALFSFRGTFRAGFTPEFMALSEGYPGLRQTYGLRLDTKVIQSGLMYDALHHGAVDVISGYSTDGRIRAYGLRTLRDDKLHFPAYECGFTVRQATLRQYPELKNTLEKLSGQFTDQRMIALNYQVDVLKQSPAAVAKAFLESRGLWKRPVGERRGTIRVGSKIFTEQYILAEMVAQLVEGYTALDVEIRAGMGGTQLCFEALRTGAIDLYPEYSGTGLEVILQKKNILRDSLQNDQRRVYAYVDQHYRQRYAIEWLPPLGFSNTYALLMREEQAAQLGIATISQLGTVLRQKQ